MPREFGDKFHAFNASVLWIGSFQASPKGEIVDVGIGSYQGRDRGDVGVGSERYGLGLAVVGVSSDGHPWARISVWIDALQDWLGPWEFVVHHDVREWLDRVPSPARSLFVDTGRRASYGFVTDAPVYRLSDEVIGRLAALPAAGGRMKRGRLIAVEGLDGSGKTTASHALVDALRSQGRPVLWTAEPTRATPAAARIRAGGLTPAEEVEAFVEDRRWHAENVVRPALASGMIVISDRSFWSTVAYQGARGVNPFRILARNRMFAPEPDLVVYLRLPAGRAYQRTVTRGTDRLARFETEEFLGRAEALYEQFLGPGAALPGAVLQGRIVVDADQRPADVVRDLVAAVVARLDAGPAARVR